MPGDAREVRVELADTTQVRRREGWVLPRPMPRLDIGVPRPVRAPEDMPDRRTCGLVDVDEDEQRSHRAHGHAYPSRWLAEPVVRAMTRRSRSSSSSRHPRASRISPTPFKRIEV